MALNDVLEDIKDDITPVNISSTEVISTENYSPDKGFSDRCKDLISRVEDINLLREKIKSESKIDKVLAMEVFTMLQPETASKLSPKLTGASSASNQRSAMNVIDSGYNSATEETKLLFNEILAEFVNVKQDLNSVKERGTILLKALEDKTEGKPQKLVIYDKKSFDLNYTPLSVLVTMNDAKFDYPPYEGVLREAVSNLLAHPFLEQITSVNHKPSLISLFDIVSITDSCLKTGIATTTYNIDSTESISTLLMVIDTIATCKLYLKLLDFNNDFIDKLFSLMSVIEK